MSFVYNKMDLLRQTWCLSEFCYHYGMNFDEDLPTMSHFDAFMHTNGSRHEGPMALALCEFKGRQSGGSERHPMGYPQVFTREDKYGWMVEAEEEHDLPGFFLYEYHQHGLFWIPREDVPLDDLGIVKGRDGPVPAYKYSGDHLKLASYRTFSKDDPVWSAPEPG